MKTRHLIINKSIFLLLIMCLFFPTISFAMSGTEQERLARISKSRQAPVVDLHDPQAHQGATSSSSSSSGATFQDEIVFFNVGQGHAALINKIGHVPLLVDAGSSSVPYTHHEQYVWEAKKRELFVSKISARILSFWKASNDNVLEEGDYRLNILITHGDDDHLNLIHLILIELEKKKVESSFTFVPTLLLGGEQRHYEKRDKRKNEPSFLALLKSSYERRFSSDWLGMFHQGNLDFLDSSGCVTHLYCPRGTGRAKDENTWSVVTRVQINGISAMITGDADTTIKNNMLRFLDSEENLESDILLLPHHGAEGTFHKHWDERVNPRAIVAGSAPHGGLIESPEGGYRHPRGETFLNSLRLLQGRGRIWNRVSPHAIGYFCSEDLNVHIQEAFRGHEGYLFEPVPNRALIDLEQPPHSCWHLVWTDAPVYTLWTTGTLVFKGDVRTPEFIEAPHGLMGYIAVPDLRYLVDSSLQSQLIPPSEKDRTAMYVIIPDLFREKIGVGRRSDKENASLLTDLAVTEFRRILDSTDRDVYLYALQQMFREKKPIGVWSRKMLSFKWLREAIVERNRLAAKNGERLINAVNTLLSDFARREFMDWDFEGTTLVLKTFLKSHHPLQQLNKYIATLSVVEGGVCPKEIEDLCPLGFHEWLQLEKLVSFVRKEIIIPSGEPISVGDVIDILPLRLEGKNFKEIGCFLVEMEGSVDIAQQEAIDSLRQFVESLRETVPTSAGGRISVARVADMQQQGKPFREIRQAIVESEGFHEDLQQFNELRAAMPSFPRVPYVPLTLEKFVPFDGHPTTLEEYYETLEQYFPRAMDDYLS